MFVGAEQVPAVEDRRVAPPPIGEIDVVEPLRGELPRKRAGTENDEQNGEGDDRERLPPEPAKGQRPVAARADDRSAAEPSVLFGDIGHVGPRSRVDRGRTPRARSGTTT